MTDERKQYLRSIYPLKPRGWIKLMLKQDITRKEFEFLCEHYKRQSGANTQSTTKSKADKLAEQFDGEVL